MVDLLLGCGHVTVVKAEGVQQVLLPKPGERVDCYECRITRPILSVGVPYWEFPKEPYKQQSATEESKKYKQLGMEDKE